MGGETTKREVDTEKRVLLLRIGLRLTRVYIVAEALTIRLTQILLTVALAGATICGLVLTFRTFVNSEAEGLHDFSNALFAVLGGLAALCFTYAPVLSDPRYEDLKVRVVAAGERLGYAAVLVLVSSVLQYAAAVDPGYVLLGVVSHVVATVLFLLGTLSGARGVTSLARLLGVRVRDYYSYSGKYLTADVRAENYASFPDWAAELMADISEIGSWIYCVRDKNAELKIVRDDPERLAAFRELYRQNAAALDSLARVRKALAEQREIRLLLDYLGVLEVWTEYLDLYGSLLPPADGATPNAGCSGRNGEAGCPACGRQSSQHRTLYAAVQREVQ